MAEFYFSSCAYCKMVLHSLKYPHASVCGLLIGEKKKASSAYKIVDAIPLVHGSACYLVPAIEAALYQVDSLCRSRSPHLYVVGLYHANECLKDSDRDSFICRVGEKIQANLNEAVLVTIDNIMLNIDATEPCYSVFCFNPEQKCWRPKEKQKVVLENEEQSLEVTSTCIQMKLYRELVDFDNHLDNPSLDFWNNHVTCRIESLIR